MLAVEQQNNGQTSAEQIDESQIFEPQTTRAHIAWGQDSADRAEQYLASVGLPRSFSTLRNLVLMAVAILALILVYRLMQLENLNLSHKNMNETISDNTNDSRLQNISQQTIDKIIENIDEQAKISINDISNLRRSIKRSKLSAQQQNKTSSIYQLIGLSRNKDQGIANGIASNRTSLGAPTSNKQQQQFLIVSEIQTRSLTQDNFLCLWVNAVSALTPNSLASYQQLITDMSFSRLIVFNKVNDQSRNRLIRRTFDQQKFSVVERRVRIDSDYKFIQPYTGKCHKVVYGLGHYEISPSEQTKQNLKTSVQQMPAQQIIFSSHYLYRGTRVALPNLQISPLASVRDPKFSLYLFIFDPSLLKMMTPLNFAYFAKYTLEQILILPMLALTKNSPNLKITKNSLHQINSVLHSHQVFKLTAPPVEKSSMCFVSSPYNSHVINQTQLINYTKSISQLDTNKTQISVVIYLPINPKTNSSLLALVKQLGQLLTKSNRIRIRFRSIKAESSFAAYESTYVYCPDKTIIVSSRHNLMFDPSFGANVITRITQEKHYYFVQIKNNQNEVIKFGEPVYSNSRYKKKYLIRKSDLFLKYFRHMQIFKSDFMKTNVFWILKSAQVDFYETEAAFVTLMMEQIQLQFRYIPKVLATVVERDMIMKQKRQFRNIQTYGAYSKLIDNKLMPYTQNCLENSAFQRNSPYKMPLKIHQVWFSNQKVSALRMKLHESFIKNNPESAVKLWKLQDVTSQNFPSFYNLITKVLQVNKFNPTSVMAMAADLARYEIVYRHGGIYVDFKMECKKSLKNFFKYEALFLDVDVESYRFKDPKALLNGIMGSVQNSHHLKVMIHELLYEQSLVITGNVPESTGSYVLRKSVNYKQVFTMMGLGSHLFFPLPYSPSNACVDRYKRAMPGQVGFKVGEARIALPCKKYPEVYMVNYPPLAKTWKKKVSETVS